MTTRIDFPAGSGAATNGELALPEGSEKAPALVLVQEWWGVNDHIRSLADRFAKAGFVTLAPDLYHGTVTKDAGEAGKLMAADDGNPQLTVSGHEDKLTVYRVLPEARVTLNGVEVKFSALKPDDTLDLVLDENRQSGQHRYKRYDPPGFHCRSCGRRRWGSGHQRPSRAGYLRG